MERSATRHTWPAELGLVLIVAVAIELQVAVAWDPGLDPAGWPGYVMGALMALVLVARKRWPLGVVLAVALLLTIYNLLKQPGFSPVVPMAVPLYNAARAGRLWWAATAAVIAVGTTLGYNLIEDQSAMTAGFSRAVLNAALLVALLLLGETVRSRRALADEMRRAAAHAALEREAEANRKTTQERLHIARELHDVLAHTLAGAAVQAGVAADTLADDPKTSRIAIEAVRGACREARTELAATLGVLRAGGPPDRAPMPGINQLAGLFDLVRDAGLRVDLSVEGEQAEVPPTVSLTTFRIVQESLTNVVRHAQARSVQVSLTYNTADLTLSITDDGIGSPAQPQTGFGLIGMRERAAAIGGRFTAGDHPAGGYQVVAALPTEPARVP
jgi:signal transduction histidine kinase